MEAYQLAAGVVLALSLWGGGFVAGLVIGAGQERKRNRW